MMYFIRCSSGHPKEVMLFLGIGNTNNFLFPFLFNGKNTPKNFENIGRKLKKMPIFSLHHIKIISKLLDNNLILML